MPGWRRSILRPRRGQAFRVSVYPPSASATSRFVADEAALPARVRVLFIERGPSFDAKRLPVSIVTPVLFSAARLLHLIRNRKRGTVSPADGKLSNCLKGKLDQAARKIQEIAEHEVDRLRE